jgi:hypothetical protein
MGFKNDYKYLKDIHLRLARHLRTISPFAAGKQQMQSMYLIDKLLSAGFQECDIAKRIDRAAGHPKAKLLVVELGIKFIYDNWHSLQELQD